MIYMNLSPIKFITPLLITLIFVSVFAMPVTTHAAWGDILGQFGIGNTTQSSNNYGQSYDYNSTVGYNDGDIKLIKEVKRIGQDDKYHDIVEIRSGALVEVWIEVKNTSSRTVANTVVRDELGGGSVYVKNSLRVNGQTSQPGLTSGGLRIAIPANGKATIIYHMNVCNGSTYPIRAYASAAGVGAATDAIIITSQNFNVGQYSDSSTCFSEFQNFGNTVNATTGTASTSNPFGDWTGVNNAASAVPANNPFGDWYGSTQTTTTSAPFGEWTGVQSSSSNTNPFSDWYGSSQANTSSASNPFGDWTGSSSTVNSSDSFGDWTGVHNNSMYNESGYSNAGYSETSAEATYALATENYTSTMNDAGTASTPTYFVAPTTGVNPVAPFIFAGLLTAAFVIFRNRKLLFN